MSAPAAPAPGVADGYARLRPGGAGAAVPGARDLVWVEGPDAAGFLQGLLSNDVAALPAGGACHALLLDAKGHLTGEARVHRDAADAFTLVLDAGAGAGVAEVLDRYHFSEDLELLGPEPSDVVTVGGLAPGAAEAAGADLTVPGPVPGTVDLLTADPRALIAALGVPEAPAEALEMARVAAGRPRVGRDTGPKTLVQEAALEDAVSFDKGCYLGQETVARLQFRGRANRRLRALLLPAPAEPHSAVRMDGREVGRVTSACVTPDLGPIGLAILRREAGPGDRVTVDGVDGEARVADPPLGGS